MQTSLVFWPHLLHDASQVMGVGSRMEYVCYLSSFCWWNEPTFGLDPGLACRSEQSTAGHCIEGQVKSAFCKGDSVQHHSVRQCYVLTSLETSAIPFCQLWLVWCSQHSHLFTVHLCLVLPGLNTGIEAPVVIISPVHFPVWPRHLLFLSGNCQKDSGIQNMYISQVGWLLPEGWRSQELSMVSWARSRQKMIPISHTHGGSLVSGTDTFCVCCSLFPGRMSLCSWQDSLESPSAWFIVFPCGSWGLSGDLLAVPGSAHRAQSLWDCCSGEVLPALK